MHDEQFAADLRPDSVFGTSGTDDYFDDDGEDDVFDEVDDDVPMGAPQQTAYAQPGSNAVGSAPVAVSGAPFGTTPNGSMGAALTLFFLLGGAGVGWYFGKFKGAAGGALVGGALRNLYRAQRTFSSGGDTMGAIRQGAVGTVAAAGGSYLLWTANRK